MKDLKVFILAICCLSINNLWGKQVVNVVGFYSACFHLSNMTNLHRIAGLYYNLTKSRMPCDRTSHCVEDIIIRYEGYDVCEDQQKLVQLFVSLLLDERHNPLTRETNNTIEKKEVNLVVTFLVPWMQKLVCEIGLGLQREIIPMGIFNEEFTPQTESYSYIIIEDTVRQYVSVISKFFNIFKWEKIGIIYLQNAIYPTSLYSNCLLYTSPSPRDS